MRAKARARSRSSEEEEPTGQPKGGKRAKGPKYVFSLVLLLLSNSFFCRKSSVQRLHEDMAAGKPTKMSK